MLGYPEAIPDRHHSFHVLKIKTNSNRFASESYSFVSGFLFLLFNLFGKEIKTQRTGRFIMVDILALGLIALHKKLVF